ncbi:MAG: glycosyltransferase [Candidatus Omnitrophota bacterium]|jgi:glycosyltransferase involved in cell wall biosynthesis
MKKVSVIIPAYNKAELTVETVESVLAQTYGNTEIIVIDDGSTDNTKVKLEPYLDRIKYVYKKNGGACSARNLGISIARGQYIGLLDCDDLYLPEKIELSVNYLEDHPDFGFVHSAAYFIDEKGKILRTFSSGDNRCSWIGKKLLLKNFICNSTVVAKKSCFEKSGVFDEEIFTPADWDMWLRLAENYKTGYIDKPLTMYRVSSAYILKNTELFKNEERKVLEKAFKRNNKLSRRLKGKIFANAHFRCAQNYILTDQFAKAKKEMFLSFCKNKFNLIFFLIWVYSLIAPKSLKILLEKKIFYNFGS